MELKVWVDGVQRIVCGVTEVTTCQEVVIALAQAIGRTGRYTLVEKWREAERPLAPYENPVVSLNKWGQYAGDVQLVLMRMGSSRAERPISESLARVPERGLYRQSLPPLAKSRPPADRSFRRREPKRKSLTFVGGAKGLMDIFGMGKEYEVKQRAFSSLHNGSRAPSPRVDPARELTHLVQLQNEKLRLLERRLGRCEAELREWVGHGSTGGGAGELEEEFLRLEQRLRKTEAEAEEEEFWAGQLQMERENERQLKERLHDLRRLISDCEAKLGGQLAHIQSMEASIEAERLKQEMHQARQVNEEELKAKALKAKAELDLQNQRTARLESSCKAVERSLGQSGKRLQEREQEMDQLTRELRQVNLQQFIQQTGTKVTVLPAGPSEDGASQNRATADLAPQSSSLKRRGCPRPPPGNLRLLHSPLSCALNPEGIYV